MKHVEVPLSRGYVALIDESDAARVLAHRWSARPGGRTVYGQRSVRRPDGVRTKQSLHSFITGFAETDHIDGDGLNNRRSNLREASRGENKRNQRRYQSNTSGFKGVSWHRGHEKWSAYIGLDGKLRHLGYFLSAEEAARVRDDAARGLHGDFATLNFPRPGERPA